jgi:MFS family permease
VLVAGTLTAVAGFAILTFAHHQEWQALIAMVVIGLGYGLSFSATSTVIVDAVPAHQVGIASGMNVNSRNIGGAVGAALMSSILAAHLLHTGLHAGLPANSGYTYGFGAVGAASIIAVLAALLVPRHRKTGAAPSNAPASPDKASGTRTATAAPDGPGHGTARADGDQPLTHAEPPITAQKEIPE